MKRPASQYYWADWRSDTALQSCSLSARGLWHEANCLMHDCDPYGHLMVGKSPMSPAQLARLVGISSKEVAVFLSELETAHVFSRNESGAIFSRRMVRDEDLRERRAAGGYLGAEHGVKGGEFGHLGGNPKKTYEYNEPGHLYAVQRVTGGPIKVGITKAVGPRLKLLQSKITDELKLLLAVDVADMGASEAAVHVMFNGRRTGEWLDAEWGEVEAAMKCCVYPPLHRPLDPPPSSPSSSPSATDLKTSPPASAGPPAVAVKFAIGIADLISDGIDPAVAADWLAVRKSKRAPLTRTAWDGVKREALSAGLSADAAVRMAVERGWQSFKAEWATDAPQPGRKSGVAGHPEPAWRQEQRERTAEFAGPFAAKPRNIIDIGGSDAATLKLD